LNHSIADVIIAAVLRVRRVCTYCNISVFSSSMAKHIKDKHQKEAAAEQESRAGACGRVLGKFHTACQVEGLLHGSTAAPLRRQQAGERLAHSISAQGRPR
jgi:hypothetical protein